MNEEKQESVIQPYTPGQEKLGRRLIRVIGALTVWAYRATGGRIGNRFRGGPVALLTTIGRRSAKPRTTPVVFCEDGDKVILAASLGGMSTHPSWYRNIEKTPQVHIQIGARRRPMRVRVADPQDESWEKLIAVYPEFRDYRERAAMAGREIPLLILEPREAGE